MNNESDYLWDKTGEPDPEIRELEEILGTLRYQPRPLELPASVSVGGRRSFFRSAAPSLAIAAAIALLVLGLGVWLGVQRLQKPEPGPQARNEKLAPAPSPSVDPSRTVAPAPGNETAIETSRRSAPRQSLLAVRGKRIHREAVNPEVAARRLEQAEAAKDQLMVAFRFVSAKLAYVDASSLHFLEKQRREAQHSERRHVLDVNNRVGRGRGGMFPEGARRRRCS